MDVSPGSMSATYPGWCPAVPSDRLRHGERACRRRLHPNPDWCDVALVLVARRVVGIPLDGR